MKKPIILGVLGLFIGYVIYLMIIFFSRQSIDSSLGGWIPVATGVILFFVGKSWYSKEISEQIGTTNEKKKRFSKNISALFLILGVISIIGILFAVNAGSKQNEQTIQINQKPNLAVISLKVPDTYTSIIKVPQCDKKAIQNETYLCIYTKLLSGNQGDQHVEEHFDVITKLKKSSYNPTLSEEQPQRIFFDFDGNALSFRPANSISQFKTGLYDLTKREGEIDFHTFEINYPWIIAGRASGQFDILELVTSNSGELIRFAANFEVTAEDFRKGFLSGYVRYNSTIP